MMFDGTFVYRRGALTVCHADGRRLPISLAQTRDPFMRCLISAKRRPMSFDGISRFIWGDDEPASAWQNVRQLVRKIRGALIEAAVHERLLLTVPDFGYRWMGETTMEVEPEPIVLLAEEAVWLRKVLAGDPDKSYAARLSVALFGR